MGLTQYYTATSLDGFIADADHSLEWLFSQQQDRGGPLNYQDFIAEVGALAMGATTYEWILDHEFAGNDPSEWKWPYDVPSWVFTHRQPPLVSGAQIELTSDDVAAVHERMSAAAGERIFPELVRRARVRVATRHADDGYCLSHLTPPSREQERRRQSLHAHGA